MRTERQLRVKANEALIATNESYEYQPLFFDLGTQKGRSDYEEFKKMNNSYITTQCF